MTERGWPAVALTPIARLRAVAAAYPSAGVAETTIDLPVDQAWDLMMDFEATTPRIDRLVRKVRVRRRDGGRVRLWSWAPLVPIPLPFDVTIEPGFCIMAARFRVFVVVMAAEPTADGRTRYVHLEAVPLRRGGWLRRLFQRMVEGDVRGIRRLTGS